MGKLRFVGLDVHAESIAVAVADEGGEIRSLGGLPNQPHYIRELVKKKLGPVDRLRVCYEAGPTGYAIYWQLTQLGVHCDVIAPTLVPTKPGDRVKTDRRDAVKLVRCYRAGDLTPVWVPDPAQEALRDLVRARESAKKDQLRARNRLSKFMLRHGRRPPTGVKSWSVKYMVWLRSEHFEQPAQEATMVDYLGEVDHCATRIERLEASLDEAITKAPERLQKLIQALQALRGVAKLTAATVVAEVGSFQRFTKPKQLMGYSGLVSREHSSGNSVHRGAITKAGNAHLRRVLVESGWCYGRNRTVGPKLRQRRAAAPPAAAEVALKADHRLSKRFQALSEKGKKPQQVVTALARELLGSCGPSALRSNATPRRRSRRARKPRA